MYFLIQVNHRIKLIPLIVIGFTLTFLIPGLIIFARAHGGDAALIHACVRNITGLVRIIDANGTCLSNETALDWRIQGEQGPPGPTGLPGQDSGAGIPIFCAGCIIGGASGDPLSYYSFIGDRLAGKNLSNSYFDEAQILGVNLSGVNLNQSVLHLVQMRQVNLENAIMNDLDNDGLDTDIVDSNLNGVNMSGANVIAAGFGIRTSTLINANLSNASFTGIGILSSDFTGANLANTAFTNSNLLENNFNGADLTNVVFTNTNLIASDLTGATRTGITWINTTCPDSTNSDDNGNTCEGHLTF